MQETFFFRHSYMNGFIIFLIPTASSDYEFAIYYRKADARFLFKANCVVQNKKFGNLIWNSSRKSRILTVWAAIFIVSTVPKTRSGRESLLLWLWSLSPWRLDSVTVTINWKIYDLQCSLWKDLLCFILLIWFVQTCCSRKCRINRVKIFESQRLYRYIVKNFAPYFSPRIFEGRSELYKKNQNLRTSVWLLYF